MSVVQVVHTPMPAIGSFQILARRPHSDVLQEAMRIGRVPLGSEEALGLAEIEPMRRSVHCSGRMLGITERLCQKRLAAQVREPVIQSAGGHLLQEEGGEVGQHTEFGENQKPGGVRAQIEAVEQQIPRPPDPPVVFERAILPGGQAEPYPGEERDRPQPMSCETTESEIMMVVHHCIKAWLLGRLDQTDIDIGQRKVLRSVLENRMGIRILRWHAPHIIQSVLEDQRTNIL